MMFCKVALLIVFGSCLASATHNYEPLEYRVPKPLIQAFRPQGLKVSIPHTTGLQLFAFHGNINKPLHGNEDGQLSGEIRTKEGDYWVFDQPNVKVEIGDKIYYWMFIVSDNFGYRNDDRVYEVTDCTFGIENATSVTTEVSERTVPSTTEKFHLDSSTCEEQIWNLTETLLNLQYEIDSLKDTNLILRDMLGRHPTTSTTLTLHGPLPEDNRLALLVRDVIVEKLGLDIRIRNVAKKNNSAVKFEVVTLDDKVAVVKAARRKLKYSKYSIVY